MARSTQLDKIKNLQAEVLSDTLAPLMSPPSVNQASTAEPVTAVSKAVPDIGSSLRSLQDVPGQEQQPGVLRAYVRHRRLRHGIGLESASRWSRISGWAKEEN